jgi:hypothetical protein
MLLAANLALNVRTNSRTSQWPHYSHLEAKPTHMVGHLPEIFIDTNTIPDIWKKLNTFINWGNVGYTDSQSNGM